MDWIISFFFSAAQGFTRLNGVCLDLNRSVKFINLGLDVYFVFYLNKLSFLA